MGTCCSTSAKHQPPHGSLQEEESSRDLGSSDGGEIGLQDIQVDGPLTKTEINSRIEQCEMRTVRMDNCVIRYAYVSQRGYYPDDLTKANQDSFCVAPHFNNDNNMSFFAVFDGHGSKGHLAAQFARDAVQSNLARRLRQNDDFDTAFQAASIDSNDQLHKSRIDDSMSGTTYIGVMVKDGVLHVANCGDSRAIIAQKDDTGGSGKRGEKLIARPLSIDQTPFRKDERERVKKCGARVMTMDQLDGLEPIHENWGVNLGEEIDDSGDPPRIWARDGDYPGTAFTRSIGDAVSERLGVFAEPEITVQPLTPHDRFVVVASDGVFEFLTSQAVVDMVQKFDDPLKACRAVVLEAYQLWLQYEVRTDDITMICMFISDVTSPQVMPRLSRAMSGQRKPSADAMRPVRMTASRAKRKLIEKAMADEDDAEEYVPEDHIVPKSAAEMRSIAKAVDTNFLFTPLSVEQRKQVFNVMRKEAVTAGQWVITQGADGDSFFVVDSGSYEVRVAPPGTRPASGGELVHQYAAGGHFGELALMYSKPRAASVICREGGTLWALDRAAFRSILMRSESRHLKRTLRRVEVLKSMNHMQIERLVETLSEMNYKDGQTIIKQGELGDTFYIITSGAAVCTIRDAKAGAGAAEKEVLQLKQFDYFGERALLTDAPRAATVRAVGQTKCLMIGRAAFEQALGPLERIIDQDRRRREKAAARTASRSAAGLAESQARPQFAPVRDVSLPQHSIFLDEVQHVSTADLNDATEVHYQYSIVNVPGIDGQLGVKTVGKVEAEKHNHGNSVANERWIWATLPQPQPMSVPTLLSTCSDSGSLHLLTSAPAGGEFVAVMDQGDQPMAQKEQAARFYVACAVTALEYLHNNNVLIRGICPELLTVGTNGYLQITDFRFAKKCTNIQRAMTICGVPSYMPPEQVSSQGQTKPGDWWALGVMLYEMLAGAVPFGADSASELKVYDEITSFNGRLQTPAGFPADAKALCEGLLCPEEQRRFGAQQVKKHAWFKGFNWSAVTNGTAPAPMRPSPVPTAGGKGGLELQSHLTVSHTGDGAWFDGF